jgi:hypothetical protein
LTGRDQRAGRGGRRPGRGAQHFATSLAGTGSITLGGQPVGVNGGLPAPTYPPIAVHGASATVTVAPGSAVIVQLR